MDIKLDTRCPYCDSELTIREIPAVVLTCPLCHVVAVLGDDRFISTQDMTTQELDAKLHKRADRLAEAANEAKNRYVDVKR